MPVEYFIKFRGMCYDVGTRLKFKQSTATWEPILIGVIEKIAPSFAYIRATDGKLYEFSTVQGLVNFEKIIIEIVSPVYYTGAMPKRQKNQCVCPSQGDVDIGWMWYIIIMVVGTIFNARLTIWIFASLIFFAWKNGYMNGGK